MAPPGPDAAARLTVAERATVLLAFARTLKNSTHQALSGFAKG